MLGRLLSQLLGGRRDEPPSSGNPLADYFFGNRGRIIQKWHHYFDIYHRHFAPFRGRSPHVLEIGVFEGGSLQMWREYFGPGCRLVGIDTDPRCRAFAEDGVTVLIGDQANRAFLADVRSRFPPFDIVIDDGGHTMEQQITAFEELYPHVQAHGLYVCEDVHTSFVEKFGGGRGRPGTFLEHAKGLIDRLYGWYGTAPHVDDFTRSIHALHFYDSIVVVEKRPKEPPRESMTGNPPLR